jgi:hypothetical protein
MSAKEENWADLEFLRADGSTLRLAEFANRTVLLILLRHLA